MNENKNRLLLALLMTTILLSVIPLNVIAMDITYDVDFEGTAPGSDADNTAFYSYATSGTFQISSTYYRSGSRGFLMEAGSNGSFAFKIDTYLTNFSFYKKLTGGWTNSNYFFLGFYNSTYQTNRGWATAQEVKDNYIYLMTVGLTGGGASYNYYYDENGLQVQIGGATTYYSSWFYTTDYRLTWFSFDTVYGDMTLGTGTYSTSANCCNATMLTEGHRIDRFIMYQTASVPAHLTFDDMNITFSDSFGGTFSGCSDFTGYTPVGRFAYGNTNVNSIHVSTRYNVPVTTTIHGIEVQISENQYDADHDVSNYQCSVNGVELGNAKCIFAESYYYVVQWECDVSVTNQIINFDFSHTQAMNPAGSGYQYWDIGCGISSTDDVNGDGEVGFYWQDSSVVYHWEWVYGIPFFVPTYGAGTTYFPRDLGMRFWCSGFVTEEVFSFDSLLGLSHYSGTNSTGYLYDLSNGYDNIMGSYTLGSSASTYTLNLYVNDTFSYDYGFPITCRYPGDGFGFSPDTIGKYYFQLNSTHALANVTAWVTGTRSGYNIRTNPVISNQYQSYTVIADYNNPQGNSGGIAMDYERYVLNYFTRCMYQKHPIANNQTTTFGYQSNSSYPEYWGLYVYANSIYTKVSDCTHFIRLPSIYTNEIHTPRNNYQVSPDGLESLQVSLSGQHMFPGADVRIYANGIYVMNVGDKQYFSETFYPKKYGFYNVTLYLYQNGTASYLANCNFTVSSTLTPDTEDLGDSFSFIPTYLYVPIAIGIIVGFMLFPYFLMFSMNTESKNSVTLPSMGMTVLSFALGTVGFILDILFGLLEWWTVFVFIFILLMVFLIMWIQRKTG